MIKFVPSFVPSIPLGTNSKPESRTARGCSSEDDVLMLYGGLLSGDAPGASQGSSNKPPEEKHQVRQLYFGHK